MNSAEIVKNIQEYGNSIKNFELNSYLALSIMLLIILYATLRFFLFKDRKTMFGKIEIVVPSAVLMSYIIFAIHSFVKNDIFSLFISSIITAMFFTFTLSGLLKVNRDLSDILKDFINVIDEKNALAKALEDRLKK
ncbi:hypothetical protein [Cetobacterium sp.]|uniref:hypothetical protein n=1 Tax=Cetobacterium sp. TaxID=2071632 RepID=UPI003F30E3A1